MSNPFELNRAEMEELAADIIKCHGDNAWRLIADFCIALREGRGKDWANNYMENGGYVGEDQDQVC